MRSFRLPVALALCAALAAPARADPAARGRELMDTGRLAEALAAFTEARHQAAEGGYDFSCEIGMAHHGLGDPARAYLFLGLCLEKLPDPAREARARHLLTEVTATLQAGGYAPVTIVTKPPAARAYVATLDPVDFSTPRLVWLPIASHTIGARAPGYYETNRQVILYTDDPATIEIVLEPVTARPTAPTTTVDFGDEAAKETTTSDDLPKVKRETLMPERFRRGGVSYRHQRALPSRFELGVEAGLSRSRLSGAAADDPARLGAVAALHIAYRVTPRLGLTSGLGFTMRGTDRTELDYVIVPVLVRYLQPAGPVAVAAVAGGELAVAAHGRYRDQSVAPLDLAAVGGVEVRLPIRGRAIAAAVRYALGLTTVDAAPESTITRNRSLSLTAELWF